MLKLARTIGILLVIVFLSTLTVFAADSTNLGKKPITVTKLSGTIKLDGKSSDAGWKKATDMYKSIDTVKVTATGAWYTNKWPAGCARVTSLKYLYDSKAIYCYISVSDSQNYTQNISDPLAFDSVEYHIDAKNCDRSSYNGKCDAQYRLSRPYKRANGKTYTDVSGWGPYNGPAFKVNSKSVGTSSSYQQEVKILTSWHGVSGLKSGQKIGWDIQVNDARVQRAGRTYQLVWNSKDNAWIIPSSMGTLVMK